MSSDEWRAGVEEQLRFYVYLLIDPRDESIFYVGKGTGDRCFRHVGEAGKTSGDALPGYGKLHQIRAIESGGSTVRIDVLRYGLTEDEALRLEGSSIDLLGLETLTNKNLGHGEVRKTADDVNADLGAIPALFNDKDDLLLFRVSKQFQSGMSDDDVYEITRRWWILGPRRLKATHALAVHAGVVRGAYRIEAEGWSQPDDDAIEADPSLEGRWAFTGESDPTMVKRFQFTDVTTVFDNGAQNPVRYIGC